MSLQKAAAAETKSPAPKSSSLPASILKPASIVPDSSTKKSAPPPSKPVQKLTTKPAAKPQLEQLDELDSMDGVTLEDDATPPDPLDYDSDDTLELDYVFTQRRLV